MPWPGPVEIQARSAGLRWGSGAPAVQPAPSSTLCTTRRLRGPRTGALGVPLQPPVAYRSDTRPVAVSTTGAGLPCASSSAAPATTFNGPQLRPPSVDLRITMSLCPISLQVATRPSAKASRAPEGVVTSAGIRKQR